MGCQQHHPGNWTPGTVCRTGGVHRCQVIRCRITETKGRVQVERGEVVRCQKKMHSRVQERTINTNVLPAQWATSSQVGVVSIAVNAIYLLYWPITTPPLCAPAEGSPAVSQQGHRRAIDWGDVPFLQADPHSCICLLFLSLYPTPSPHLPFIPPTLCLSIPLPLLLPLYLLPCLSLSFRLFSASLFTLWGLTTGTLSGRSCKNQ